MNTFRMLIYERFGQVGLKDYNAFVLKNRSEIFSKKMKYLIFFQKNLSDDVALKFIEIYFNSVIEDYFKENFSINSVFFNKLLRFFNNGHVVCGYQFLTSKHEKIYNIFTYPVDSFNSLDVFDEKKVVVFVF